MADHELYLLRKLPSVADGYSSVQECDARMLNSSTNAKDIKEKITFNKIIFAFIFYERLFCN